MRNDVVSDVPSSFNFGEGYGEVWELVYPDRNRLTLPALLEWMYNEGNLDEDQWQSKGSLWMWNCECEGTFPEPWRTISMKVCPRCGGELENSENELRDVFAEYTQEHSELWEPMMNYLLPFPNGLDHEAVQADLLGHSIGVVMVRGDPFLVLQGGGMDMSWEICAAYVALGCLPPAHYSELPAMAGRGECKSDLELVGHCIASLEMLAGWNQRAADWMREQYSVAA